MDVLLQLLVFILVPFLGALATFFTGFGLNTILVPVFLLYWDAPIAVLMAGIVHLCNNILKVALTARSINWNLFQNFGIPAIIFAFLGAFLLSTLTANTTTNLESLWRSIEWFLWWFFRTSRCSSGYVSIQTED
jgi:uncharacterized membrane protein YfcA